MPGSGDPAQGEGMAHDPAAGEPAGNQPVLNELEQDDGPHNADAGSCPVRPRPPRRSFLRGAAGAGVAGVAGVVAGSAAGAAAGYAYRSSRPAPAGQVLDAEMLAGRCRPSRSTAGTRRASCTSRRGRR